MKPMVLEYIGEKDYPIVSVSDISDISDTTQNIDHQEKHSDKKIQTMSVASDRSVTISKTFKQIEDIPSTNPSFNSTTINLDIAEQIRRTNIIRIEKSFLAFIVILKPK